ncbi:MAG: beta strand repeat-containing protein [Limisphaerales bacterium]
MMKSRILCADQQVRKQAAPVLPSWVRAPAATALLALVGTLSAAAATTYPVVFVDTPALVTFLENGSSTSVPVVISAPGVQKGLVTHQLSMTAAVTPAGVIQVKVGQFTAAPNADPLFGKTTYTTTLSVLPLANAVGNATITLTAIAPGVTNTATIPVTITPVNQAPSFTLSTNQVVVAENSGAVKISKFLLNLSAGPSNEKSQVFDFTVSEISGGAANVVMSSAPQIDVSGNLYFEPASKSYGTNLVTVIMTDNGGTDNGGVDSFTNTFLLEVAKSDVAPVIDVATLQNPSIPEGQFTNLTVYVYSAGITWSNLSLVPTVNNKDVTVATGTPFNAAATNNSAATLAAYARITNAGYANVAAFPLTVTAGSIVGAATVSLKASDGQASSAVATFTANVQAADEPPSFTVSAPIVLTTENSGLVTNKNFLKNLSAGPANQSKLTYGFTCTTPATSLSGTNVLFNGIITTNITGTNGGVVQYAYSTNAVNIDTNGTLTFWASTNSFGTNLVTVVMTNSGSLLYGGDNAYTNTFLIGVTPLTVVTNSKSLLNIVAPDVSVYQQSTNVTVVLQVYGLNSVPSANFTLTVTNSTDGTVANVPVSSTSLTSTNEPYPLAAFGTNAQDFVLTISPPSSSSTVDANSNPTFDKTGFTVVQLKATDATGTNTAYASFYFSVLPYTDPPAFALASSSPTLVYENIGEVAIANFVTAASIKASANGYGDQGTDTLSFAFYQSAVYPNPTNSNLTLTNGTGILNITNFAIDATSGTLTFSTPPDVCGTNTVTVVLANSSGTANGAINTATNTFVLEIAADQPAFTLPTTLVVAENVGLVSESAFATAIFNSAHAHSDTQRNAQTAAMFAYNSATYVLTNDSKAITNTDVLLSFTNLTIDAASGNLTLSTPPNQFGTNLVTVVMQVWGGTNNSGTNWATNTFVLEIAQDQPTLTLPGYLLVNENAGAVSQTAFATALAGSTATPPSVFNNTNITCANSQTYVWPTTTQPRSDVELTLTNLSIDPVSGNLKFNTPPNQFGTNLVTVVMQVWNTGTVGTNTVVMGGTNTFTTTFVLGIAAVDTPPVFTLLTTNYTVSQYDTPLTISHLITGYSSAGTSPWQSTQTVTFAVSTTTAGSNYFSAAPHLVGSNLLFTALNAGAGKTAPVTIVATDSGSPGGVYTSTQTVAFVFPATIYDSYQGTYEGLYYSTTDLGPAAYQSSGFISLTLNADGTIAGYLQNGSGTNGGLNGYTNVWLFTNAFDTVYPDTLETFKTYAPSNYFQLSLSFDSSSMTITGTVANTHPGIDFPAVDVMAFKTINAAPTNYNVVVLGSDNPTNKQPVGDSIVGLKVASGGGVSLTPGTGFLADGSSIPSVAAAKMCMYGYYPLYSVPNGTNTEVLYGWLQFITNSSQAVQLSTNSIVSWLATANGSNGYTAGFTNQSTVVGSGYNPSSSSMATVLPFKYAWIVFGDVYSTATPETGIPLANEILINTDGSTSVLDGTADSLSLTIDPTTGIISGSFINANGASATAAIPISGLIVPSAEQGAGFFLDGGISGEFILIGIAD